MSQPLPPIPPIPQQSIARPAQGAAGLGGVGGVTAVQPVEVTQDDGQLAVISKGLDVNQQVVTNGQSRLQNGTRVITTRGPGQPPNSLALGDPQTLAFWRLGVPGMRVGGIRRLIVPPALAFGTAGNSSAGVPPNTTLVIDVEPHPRWPTMVAPDGGHPLLTPIAALHAFYRLAEATALRRGRDPDQPPHLMKVTRTV